MKVLRAQLESLEEKNRLVSDSTAKLLGDKIERFFWAGGLDILSSWIR